MTQTPEQVIAGFKVAQKQRSNWEPKWKRCYELALPNRAGFTTGPQGSSLANEIFDSTAVTAVQEFASRMQSGLTPTFMKWFDFNAGSEIPEDEREKINEELEAVSTYVWEVLQASNLDQELHESYIDLAIGTGTMSIEEGDAVNPVKFTTIPQAEVFALTGPFGFIDTIYRLRSLRLGDIKAIWKNAKIHKTMEKDGTKDPEKRFEVIECVKRDWSNRGDEVHDFCVIDVKEKHEIVAATFKGDGSAPIIAFRWSKAAGETYGRGPLLNSMPDVETLNLVVELTLQKAEIDVVGMWQADDDGVVNPDVIELVPGTIVPRAMGSRGLEPLQSGGRMDMTNFILSDMRHNIRKALFTETLGKPEGTPMSATEAHERMADVSRVVGSAYGRLLAEQLTPLLRRVVYILRKQGKITIPKVNGREVKILYVSPLAQAQHNENVGRVGRFAQFMNAAFGPQMTNVIIDAGEAAQYVARESGVPEALIRSDAERDQIQQAINDTQKEATAQQQGAMQ